MNILISPYRNDTNEYINLIKKSLKEQGHDVVGFKQYNLLKLFFTVDIIYLNWYENSKNKIHLFILIEYVAKFILLLLFKIRNVKIIWAMHNKLPHNSANAKLSLIFIKFLLRISDTVIILSNNTINEIMSVDKREKYLKKIRLLPHPNYIGVYGNTNENLRSKYNIKDNELVFLFVGSVSPYKNIELLIEAFSEACISNSKLIIAGKPISQEYELKLTENINNPNIITVFKFIDNDELIKYINTSDVIVLPYNKKSSLNSGAIFLGFSYKKPVISSNIGTVEEFKDKEFCISYNYYNDTDHKEELICKLREINNIFQEDKSKLKKIGEDAYDFVKQNNDIRDIGNKLNEIFNWTVNPNINEKYYMR